MLCNVGNYWYGKKYWIEIQQTRVLDPILLFQLDGFEQQQQKPPKL